MKIKIKKNKMVIDLFYIYGLACIVFSNTFYKFTIGGITPSEILLIISIIILNKNSLLKKLHTPLLIIAPFFLTWLILSFTLQRESYFILRQSAAALYLLTLPVASVLFHDGKYEFRSIHFFFVGVCIIAGFTLKFGHMDTAIPLLMFMLMFRRKINSIAFYSILLAFFLTGHASHKLALLIFLGVRYFYYWRAYVVFIAPTLILAAITFMGYLYNSGELTDANATWRYIYWQDMVIFLLHELRWLTGIGYGVPYINPAYDNFQSLYSQVEAGRALFQIYTVPPHNSFLVIFYHLGIVPFFCLLYMWLKALLTTYKNRNFNQLGAVFGFLFILTTHNALELPYMALFCNLVLGAILLGDFKRNSLRK